MDKSKKQLLKMNQKRVMEKKIKKGFERIEVKVGNHMKALVWFDPNGSTPIDGLALAETLREMRA